MATKNLPGLGPSNVVARPAKGLAPAALQALGPEEGFVLSRVDGVTTLGQILLLVPFDEATTVKHLRRLFELGAIDIPGQTRPTPPPTAPQPPRQPARPAQPARTPTPARGTAAPVPVLPQPLGPEEGKDLTPEQRARIDAFFAALEAWNAFELLGVERNADVKDLKRAYFKLSKEFHPDRFFGKNIGAYKDRLSRIFQTLKSAFELLSDPSRRQAYLDSLPQ